ncbi:MAG TPA: mechanosensitive ion channel protein MscS [Sulfurospirillum sp. UBA12182]|jgi:MscS family membrane protein|nr:MAG TPA: mechanosensitive ion channel protein MscS [Sulfurospirillum sp. UBA12182]
MQEILNYTVFDIRILDLSIAIIILMLSFLLRQVISKIIIKTLKELTAKTKTTLDDTIVEVLEEPLKLSSVVFGFFLAKEWLHIETFDGFLSSVVKSFALFILFWILYRLIDNFEIFFIKFSQKFGKELSKDIENFIIKTLRLIIIVIAIMSILQEWGINVTAFVASLGLVGMAFALAAKDTAANLFGSLVIFTDRPFKIGDWIQTPQVEGTVEEIGIRSTKVRTFAQALVSVPNANIANEAITNWSRMGKRRIKMRLGLTYATNTNQMNLILEQIRQMLKDHSQIHQDTIMIYFDEFSDSSLSLFCYFFTKTTVWAEYLQVREDVNLKIMKIVEDNKASFAFPSQSLYIEKLPDKSMI